MTEQAFFYKEQIQTAGISKPKMVAEEQGLDKPRENPGPRATEIKELFKTNPSSQNR